MTTLSAEALVEPAIVKITMSEPGYSSAYVVVLISRHARKERRNQGNTYQPTLPSLLRVLRFMRHMGREIVAPAQPAPLLLDPDNNTEAGQLDAWTAEQDSEGVTVAERLARR